MSRSYPVVLEFTERRIVLVDAESRAEALREVKSCPEEYWSDGEQTEVIDGIQVTDDWRENYLIEGSAEPLGPPAGTGSTEAVSTPPS